MEGPKCIGVIIDGNRRWARTRGLPLMEGHREGYRKLKDLLSWAKEAGITHVIVYIFSIENWGRAKKEVSYLMKLVERIFENDIKHFKKENAQIRVIGKRSLLPRQVQNLVDRAEKETALCTGPVLALALSYGGRDEIVAAVNTMLQERKRIKKHIAVEDFSQYLWSSGLPDPDLIIRTSGEMRLSNFLPWQSVYSELFFPNTLWPDFTKEEFFSILEEYKTRQRRFGK